MRRKIAVPVLFAFVLVTACGTTPVAKTEQTAQVIVSLIDLMADACDQSKKKGWQEPLTLDVCTKASIAAEGAWEAVKTARTLLKQGLALDSATLKIMVGFVIDAYKLLKEAGVKLPSLVTDYMGKIEAVVK